MSIRAERSILLLSIIACSLSFGLNYGISNQNTYLIQGLTLIDPSFLIGDWFAHNTHHYHNNFSIILIAVNSIGLPIPESLAFIEIALRILALYAIYKIVLLVANKQAFTTVLLILALIVFERTKSLAGSYIFSTILQPSSFGAAFFLLSSYFFLRGKYFLSGLCMAFSGLMHTNFLLLGFVVFGLAHLFLGVKGILRRMSLQFPLMLSVFAFNIPFLLSMISSEHGEQATYIFQFIRSPHHYVPNHFIYSFVVFFGWSLLGLAGLMSLKIDSDLKKRLTGLYSGLLIPIIIASLLTTIVFIPAVSKLFFWRMAPFCVLISQIAFVSSIVSQTFLGNKSPNTHKVAELSIALLGMLLISIWYVIVYKHYLLLPCLIIFLLMVNFRQGIHKILHININQKITNVATITIAVFTLGYGLNHSLHSSTLLNGLPEPEQQLYQWVKNTDTSSKFLVPPNLINFRLHGERPIIADWKSTPIDPDGLIEWYNRIEDSTGTKGVHSYKEAEEGYSNLNLNGLKALKDKYAISYAVLYTDKNTLNHNLPIVFKNSEFVVIELKTL
jgi:hypothetical protein